MMLKIIRSCCLLTLTLMTISCASKKQEQFSESFFTYLDESGKKYFSFILKLDGMQPDIAQNPFEDPQGRRVTSNGRERRLRQEDPVAMPEDPDDALVSLKFRMEEMAHEKLVQRLEAISYCPGKIKFEEEEYEKHRYKIKGFCLE
jgi:hypothetical protein